MNFAYSDDQARAVSVDSRAIIRISPKHLWAPDALLLSELLGTAIEPLTIQPVVLPPTTQP